MNFRGIQYEFRSNSLYKGIYFHFEMEGLINGCERPSVGEVGLNSDRNEDQPFSPGWRHEPGLMGCLWSRFKPPTGTNGGGPGARPIGPGSYQEPGPNGPDEPGPMPHEARPPPWAHEPGRMPPHGSRFVTEPGLMGWPGPTKALFSTSDQCLPTWTTVTTCS